MKRCYRCGGTADRLHMGETGQWRDKTFDYFDLYGLFSCDNQECIDEASRTVCDRQGVSGPYPVDAMDHWGWFAFRQDGWLYRLHRRLWELRIRWRDRHEDNDDDGLVIRI